LMPYLEALNKLKIKIKSGVPLMALGLLVGCGDGHVNIDTDFGKASELPLGDIQRDEQEVAMKAYFIDNLFPIMALDSLPQGGCAISGCHLSGDASSNEQTFFQVDPDSSDNSWQWARYRRTVSEVSSFTTNGSDTLKNRKDEGHNSFAAWSSEQKALIDTWAAME